MSACCCPPQESAPSGEHRERAQLKRRGCCDFLHVDASVPVVATLGPSLAPNDAGPALVHHVELALRPQELLLVVGVDDAPHAPATGPPRVPIYLSLLRLLD